MASATAAHYKGTVFGGQQPVVGAKVYLLQAGTGAFGSSSVNLLAPGSTAASDSHGPYVLTVAGGSFNIPTFTCPSPDVDVYLVATGGNPGNSSGATNAQLGLMSGLGSCNAAVASTAPVNIDEITTVATGSALADFMTGTFNLATDGSAAMNQTLATAFSAIPQMVNTTSGQAYTTTPDSTATVLGLNINTLADILATCINSQGVTAGGQDPCSQLLTASPNPGAADTAEIMIDIAQQPTANVSGIYSLSPANGPFQPTLNRQPSDWNLPVTATAGGCSYNCVLYAVAAGDTAAAPPYAPDPTITSNGYNVPDTIATSAAYRPAPQKVYQYEYANQNFTYTAGGFAPGSTHRVRLHFAEIYFPTPNSRVFNVNVNNVVFLSKFDIVQVTGGKDIAVVETTTTTADPNGNVVLYFYLGNNGVDQPKLSGFEVR